MTPPEIATGMGLRLRALRLQRNMTQSELAKRAGVSRPTLGTFEREGRATVDSLARIAFALGRERELKALFPPDPPSTLDEADSSRPRLRARP
jgi:transcriptional regulator with XRE-family HTH domain